MPWMKYVFLFIVIVYSFIYGQGVKLYQRNIPICELTDIKDTTYSGRILYADDSCISFWTANGQYNSDRLYQNTILFPVTEIRKIRLINEPENYALGGALVCSFVAGTVMYDIKNDDTNPFNIINRPLATIGACVIGGLIGGLIGVILRSIETRKQDFIVNQDYTNYNLYLATFKKHAIFPLLAPPELQTILKSNLLNTKSIEK